MPVILPVSLLTVRRLAEPGVIVITACQSLPKYSFGARMSKASATVGAGSRGPGGGRPRRAAARASVPSSSSEVMDRMPTLAQLRGSLRAPMAAAFANGAGGFSFIAWCSLLSSRPATSQREAAPATRLPGLRSSSHALCSTSSRRKAPPTMSAKPMIPKELRCAPSQPAVTGRSCGPFSSPVRCHQGAERLSQRAQN